MSGSYGNSFTIENRADVVRMNSLEHERDYCCFLAGRADEAEAVDLEQTLRSVTLQIELVMGNRVESDVRDVLQRSGETDDAGDVRRARFELVRQRVVR